MLKLNVKMAPEMSGFFNWLPVISDQQVVEKDFRRLLYKFTDTHQTGETLRNTSRGLTGGQSDDMFEYLDNYIIDVRFRKQSRIDDWYYFLEFDENV